MANEELMAGLGGALIGASATLWLLFSGRVTGISGIFWGMLRPVAGDTLWRWCFLLGLLLGGLVGGLLLEEAFLNASGRPLWATACAGLLVGFGTRLGSG